MPKRAKERFEHPVYGEHTVRLFDPDALREAREEAGLSQEQLAVAVGIASATLRKYELGNVSPQADTLTVLAEVLQVDLTAFFPVDENASGRSMSTWGNNSLVARNGKQTRQRPGA